ncbi:MAG: HAMP domain-containing sensor histidine kinase [Actinomycetota bacterium]|nr:HAMP domain-containing sensor histidine kinase [Actinomycetota bacterium]
MFPPRLRRRPSVHGVRQWRTSVRARLTVLGAGMLTLALTVAAGVVLFVLYHSLISSADAATSARATEIADSAAAAGVAGIDPTLLVRTDTVDLVQVLDSSGTVLAASPGDRRDRGIVGPVGAEQRQTVVDAAYGDDQPEYRVTVQGVETPTDGTVTILVGAAEGPIHATVWTVFAVLCVVFPIIVAASVVATHYLVGRALLPVESIRAEVAAISRSGRAQRVAVPATQDEIATLATTMNEMLDRLAFAREQQLQFVGDSSHELRSPLVTILGLLELARRTDEPIDQATVSTLLLPEAYRLRDLIDDMLLLARADEYGLTPDIADIDLDDLVNDEITRLDLTTELSVTAHIIPVRLRGDRRQVSRVLRNLCDNAARHAHSSVDVSMAITGRAVEVSVADDGPGVPEADRARIFDRFVRLDPTRTRSAGGAGLGLSIVGEIVRAHEGSVRVTETSGGGATVTVSLPLPADAQDDPSPPSSASR